MRTIGILGGTFDPVHLGHLHIANRVSEQLDLDEVQLMPCARPVHREQPEATAQQRCDMIRLAISDQPRLRLNTLELERAGPSYSVDTLRDLKAGSTSTLLLILGTDAFNGFARWKSPETILQLAHLVICGRPGFKLDTNLFGQHHVADAVALAGREAGAILPLEVDALDCASSRLREQINQEVHDSGCLAPSVSSYIDQHQLYR